MEILKFYASGCGPCRLVGAKLKEVELDVPITEINIEDRIEDARKYRIRTIPVVILLNDNKEEVKRWVGVFDINELKEAIKQCD